MRKARSRRTLQSSWLRSVRSLGRCAPHGAVPSQLNTHAATEMTSPLLNDNGSALPDIGVDQTPVLEASRCGEREAVRRRELGRVAGGKDHAGVHISGAVVLRRRGGRDGPRVEQQLGWAAGLG